MNAPSHHRPAVRSTCPYCGVGCGVLVKSDGHGGAIISGDPEHPANFGRLCSKGSALSETLGLNTRLLHPMQREASGALTPIGWDDALDKVADGLVRTIANHGPNAIAFYLSGQLLTEDYYVANKLMKGFIGSANIDTNSRLCMASSVAGHRRAFGADTVPGTYNDLDEAKLIVLVGSNAAWCHPVLYQRMVVNQRERGARIIVIDPRHTATAENADLFLPVAPGMDTVLFCGLLAYLADRVSLDDAYIEAHTTGISEALMRAREIAPDVATTAAAAGLSEADVARFFKMFCNTQQVVTCFSQGVNQSAQGTDKVNAIINCHLATGRIGKPGMGPFSLTGQPNAMGGREVGGLANHLAAHMGFAPAEIDRVGRFWHASNMAQREGLKAVQMFEAIERGEIKALWVMATNPAVSLPRAGALRRAADKLDLFVVSENVMSNDTVNAGAHLLLPATAWGEKDGTVTNSERRISRQRSFLKQPGEARADWWIITQVARRLGFADAFDYRSAADIFREHAALSGFENAGTRDFDISALAQLSDAAFNGLDPVQWPAPAGRVTDEMRFFAQGGFFTSDRKARFIAPEFPRLATPLSPQFPLRLNTGRTRDHWHTMTRSGLSPRLAAHAPEPTVEVHPDDATALGLLHGAFARLRSPHGTCVLKVAVSPGQQRGSLFVPIHWSAETASSACIGNLVAPASDPYSGQPEAKATPVSIAPVNYRFHGLAFARGAVALPTQCWWTKIAVKNGVGYMLASNDAPTRWRDCAQSMFTGAEIAEYGDEPRDIYRSAAFANGRFEGCLFIGPAMPPQQWTVVKELFEAEKLPDDGQRLIILSGKSTDGLPDSGPVVCACFGVGLKTIHAAIESGAVSMEAIGIALRAGTNCGSCLPEIKKIISQSCLAQTV